jgi:predicted ATPase
MLLPSVSHFKIRRFKRVEAGEADLQDVNLLIGTNNSGKTSFIQGMHFAISVLQSITHQDKWTIAARSTVSFGPSELIYVPTESVYSVAHGAALTQDRATGFDFTLSNGQEFHVDIRKGKNKNLNVNVWGVVAAGRALGQIQRPYSVFCPGLAGIPKSETLVSEGVLRRAVARGDANVVLRNTLYRLSKRPDDWATFQRHFNVIFPNIEIKLLFDEQYSETIDAYVTDKSTWYRIPLELAGTGMLQTAQILSYISYFRPKLLILDEPDSHLHPNNQRALCELLQSISFETDTQIVIASHSRHVLDVMGSIGSVISASKGSFSVVENEQEMSLLLELGALDLQERILVDGLDAILLTEDSDTKPIRMLVDGTNAIAGKLEIMSYKGCSNTTSAALLIKFLKAARPNVEIFVHRDRDFMSDEDAAGWHQEIIDLHAKPLMTLGLDVESHFLAPKHLEFANPAVGEAEFEELLVEARSDILASQKAKGFNRFLDNERREKRFARVDLGVSSLKIHSDVENNPVRFMSGKDTLARLRHIYKSKHGTNLQSFQSSEHLHPFLSLDPTH